MRRELLDPWFALAWPGRLTPLLERHRADAIVGRVRAFASLFAVMTFAWILLDAFVLQSERLLALAAARIVAGALFGALVLACRLRSPTLAQARARLCALLLIPVAFFIASQVILPAVPEAGWPRGFESAYSFFPFMLAAGIGAFPLAIAESAVIAAILVAVEAAALAADRLAGLSGGPEML